MNYPANPPARTVTRLGLALVLIRLAACDRPRMPAPLPIAPLTPVVVPLPTVPAAVEDTLLGYLRVRDPVALGQGLLGTRLNTLAQEQNLPLGELRPGAGAALFVWDPAGQSFKAMPVAAVLPAPAGGALATRLSRAAGDDLVKSSAEGLLAALNPPGLLRATAAGPALWQVAGSKEPGDLLLYVNLATLWDHYGAQVKEMLGALAAQSPTPQAAAGMLEKLLQRAARLKSVSLSLSLLPQAVELATVWTERIADARAPVALAAPDLVALLPPGDVRFQVNSRDFSRSFLDYLEVYAPLLGEQPGLLAQLQELSAEWGKVMPQPQMAAMFTLRPAPRLLLIVRVADGAAAQALVRRVGATLSQGPLHELYRKQGLDVTVTVQEKARKLAGWPIDSYRYQIRRADAREGAAEVMPMGPYLLFSINDTLDTLAAAALRGSSAATTPLAARKVYPSGGTGYGDIDLSGLWAGVRALLPPTEAARMPAPPPGLGTATWFTYEGPGAFYYRLQVPQAVLRALDPGKEIQKEAP